VPIAVAVYNITLFATDAQLGDLAERESREGRDGRIVEAAVCELGLIATGLGVLQQPV
jgi:hypothetical protein